MSEKTNIKLEKDFVEKVLKIAQTKFELRNIDSYAEAVREALIEFIKNNKKYLKKINQNTSSIENQEEVVKSTQ